MRILLLTVSKACFHFINVCSPPTFSKSDGPCNATLMYILIIDRQQHPEKNNTNNRVITMKSLGGKCMHLNAHTRTPYVSHNHSNMV